MCIFVIRPTVTQTEKKLEKTMRRKVVLLLLTLTTMIHAEESEKHPFEISDLYRLRNVSDVRVSPDGTLVLYTLTTTKLKKGETKTDLYVCKNDGTETHRLTIDGRSHSGRWSKDGKSIYYVCALKRKSKKGGRHADLPQLWRMTLKNGKSMQITDFGMGTEQPIVSEDGRKVVFSAEVYPECGADSERNAEWSKKAKEGPVKAYVADSLLYRHWSSYQDGKVRHVICYDTETGRYTDLTPGRHVAPTFLLGGGTGYALSPDGREVCLMSNHEKHPESTTNADLWTVSTEGGTLKNVTEENRAWDGEPQYSPDGRYIAYKSQATPGYEADCFDLVIYDRVTGERRLMTESLDNWVDDFRWSRDGKSLLFSAEAPGCRPLYRIEVKSGRISRVTEDVTVFSYDEDAEGRLFLTTSRGDCPLALDRQDDTSEHSETSAQPDTPTPLPEPRRLKRLTHWNDSIEKEVDLRPAETMWVKNGMNKIQVFIVKPHGFDPQKKYPLILNVHGGPQSQWTASMRGDWQVYPGKGYIVAFANPTGSTGYGQAFTCAISGDWGGTPFEDLMAVTDALETLPYVDKERMGAMGWSFGGYMMNWFQAKTKRFKCLASMMGVYDLKSMWGATEELWFPNYDLGGRPWESEQYRRFSPSEHIPDFATPTLVITGERDYRVPYTQSLQYFTALQTREIPSRLIVFPNDGHWPSHVKSMPLYYAAHVDWFHRWLGGEASPWSVEELAGNRIFEKEKAQKKK